VGVEPTSEKRVSKASTCVAFYLLEVLPLALRKKAPRAAASLAVYRVLGARQTEALDPLTVSLRPAPRVELWTERHGRFLGRESEVVVRRY
jgi:hypothetical protein